MKQASNSRRSRGRGNGKRQPGRNSNYDSGGPDGRIRGNASQVYEKYLALARDALSADDRIASENYFQHAEHFYRIVNANAEAQAQKEAQKEGQGEQRADGNGQKDRGRGRRNRNNNRGNGRNNNAGNNAENAGNQQNAQENVEENVGENVQANSEATENSVEGEPKIEAEFLVGKQPEIVEQASSDNQDEAPVEAAAEETDNSDDETGDTQEPAAT